MNREPYLAHLLQVFVTVAENGGDEDQMVAAVLHDLLEDIEDADAVADALCHGWSHPLGRQVRRVVDEMLQRAEELRR